VRLWPTADNLSLYLKFLYEKNYIEREFYLALFQAVDRAAADAFEAKGITPIKPDHGVRLSYQQYLTEVNAPTSPKVAVSVKTAAQQGDESVQIPETLKTKAAQQTTSTKRKIP
jgi:hypothetical protein